MLILMWGTRGIALKLIAGCSMKNRKLHVRDVMQRTSRIGKNILSRAEDDRMDLKIVGLEKTHAGPA